MGQGWSNREACRLVGINERTGKHWRNGRQPRVGRPGMPPITAVPAAGGRVRYLNEDERVGIADLHRAAVPVRQIAGQLGRDPSTISRELRRNAHPESGDYRPHAAHRRALARRPRPETGKIVGSAMLQRMIQDGLDQRWSPGQIVRR